MYGLYLKWYDGFGLEEWKVVIIKLGMFFCECCMEMVELMICDMGKLIGEVEGEVDFCVSFCDYYVEYVNEFLVLKLIYIIFGNVFILK